MRGVVLLVAGLVLSLLVAGTSFATDDEEDENPYPEIPRITKEQLKEMLGKPDLLIIDCRPQEQWKYSDQAIPGAIYEDPLAVESWASKYDENKKIVIY
jgi:hypothetical protein